MDENKCKNCSTALTTMETGCTRCLKCYPIPKTVSKPKVDDRKYVDVPWTDDRIWNSVKDKVRGLIEDLTVTRVDAEPIAEAQIEQAAKTYREQAKELGIKTVGRKKEDVLKDIEEKQAASVEA